MFGRKRQAPTPGTAGADRAEAPFSIYVLLSERLSYASHDVEAALAEDFPDLDWESGVLPDLPFDTATSPFSMLSCGAKLSVASITGGGPLPFAWDDLLPRNQLDPAVPEVQAIMASEAHLVINVTATGADIVDRVAAARHATAIAATFAALPIATGVVTGWSNRVIPAARLARTAQTIRDGGIPLLDWILPIWFTDPDAPEGHVSGATIGLAAFTGHEVEVRQSPLPLVESLTPLLMASTQILERGHVYADGDTLGHDGPDAVAWRIRHMKAGKLGNDTDRWVLLHPDSPFPDRKLLGRPGGRRTPPGLIKRQSSGETGWLRRRLVAFARAGAAPLQ
ncbi:hypothetical protein [uncultured Jannaschia sp.]|uniref:hypothetical protein n=1 Tax=uncultured Jannaschia sp. TaxID=293347 RepID=UPI002603B442|nr:hypothetical protein [uncultured Jannaschia sp.]